MTGARDCGHPILIVDGNALNSIDFQESSLFAINLMIISFELVNSVYHINLPCCDLLCYLLAIYGHIVLGKLQRIQYVSLVSYFC